MQQIRDLADNMSEEILQVGDCLLQEGEKLSRFFVVLEGECECSMKASSEYADSVVSKTKTKLIPQDRFGEKALLSTNTEASAQSIIALTKMKVHTTTCDNRRSSLFLDCILSLSLTLTLPQLVGPLPRPIILGYTTCIVRCFLPEVVPHSNFNSS